MTVKSRGWIMIIERVGLRGSGKEVSLVVLIGGWAIEEHQRKS
jgi:hypothetical protein